MVRKVRKWFWLWLAWRANWLGWVRLEEYANDKYCEAIGFHRDVWRYL